MLRAPPCHHPIAHFVTYRQYLVRGPPSLVTERLSPAGVRLSRPNLAGPTTGRAGWKCPRARSSGAAYPGWPGIGSASAARLAGAAKGSAKYCVSWVTIPSANSMTLTE